MLFIEIWGGKWYRCVSEVWRCAFQKQIYIPDHWKLVDIRIVVANCMLSAGKNDESQLFNLESDGNTINHGGR